MLASRAAAIDSKPAVIAAEKARGAALLRGDAAALAELLADDLRYTHATGRIESKAEIINAIAGKTLTFERFVTSDHLATLVTPDVALLNGRIDQRKCSDGKWSEVKLLFLSVWRCEGGAWRMVSIQTAIPPATNN